MKQAMVNHRAQMGRHPKLPPEIKRRKDEVAPKQPTTVTNMTMVRKVEKTQETDPTYHQTLKTQPLPRRSGLNLQEALEKLTKPGTPGGRKEHHPNLCIKKSHQCTPDAERESGEIWRDVPENEISQQGDSGRRVHQRLAQRRCMDQKVVEIWVDQNTPGMQETHHRG
ncbi:hypothetical protein NDU88_003396 [Pleurodeles waltl]|uniref:Uncharacterized protein n=1 Tax=Pleurodeles waltl TaxID=8319 RepID=A0AAV7RCR6_PLEWA|nr:hypothetical protein NDU88_003396 [Pleurodeles waltl]